MIVVDTSAVLAALAARPFIPALEDRLRQDPDLQAPHLIDVEVLHAVRRWVYTGFLSEERAEDVRADYIDLTITRYPHLPLFDRMWELRHNVTPYDAAFVALSESLEVPLITCDGRLAGAGGHDAQIEMYSPPN